MATADKIRSGIRQYETTRGRRMDPKLLEALMKAELDSEEVRAENERNYALKIRTMNAADEAADASGRVQIGGAVLNTGLLLKDTKLGDAITKGAKEGYNAVKGAVTPGTEAVAGVATPPPSVPTIGGTAIGQGTSAGGMAASAGAGAVGGMAIGQTAVLPQPAAAGMSAIGGGVGAPVGGTAAGMTAGSIASAGLGMAGGAGLGSLGANLLFPGNSTAEDIGTIGGGVVAGAMIAGPLGALAGGVIGIGMDLVEDASVICTELNRQGYISDSVLKLDTKHGKEHIDEATYVGYYSWAKPLVKVMRKSNLITQIVRPLGVAWACEMASREDPTRKGNILGKILLAVGVPICRMIGARKEICYEC